MRKIKVPKKVAGNAEKGLDLWEDYGRGGTKVGRKMASKLETEEWIEYDDVRRISEYFPRHAKDNLHLNGKNGKSVSNGYIAWMLWGGDEGWRWSKGVVERVRKRESR